jgi:hypothetical protein
MTEYKEKYLFRIKQLEDQITQLQSDNSMLTRIIIDGPKARKKLLLDGVILKGIKTPANENAIW